MSLPNTPSQRWASSCGACRSGRRRLGKQSLAQYWATCPDEDLHDLYWIARHLMVPDAGTGLEASQSQYKHDLCNAYNRSNRGRWKGQHVRAALEGVISAHKVHFPMWCF